jgi:hypothetical protein
VIAAGYWPTTYFADGYDIDGYWPDYGTGVTPGPTGNIDDRQRRRRVAAHIMLVGRI